MTGFKQVRRLGLAMFGVAILAVLALALGHSTDLGTAHADGAGMSLAVLDGDCTDGECTVDMTQPSFRVTISTAPAPDFELAGFATEVVFDSDGLNWLQRASCTDEVQVERQDGGSLAICIADFSTLLSGASHSVIAEAALPPLAALTVAPGSTTVLVELDFSCKTAGTFDLTLAAVPDSPAGAVYGDVDANEIQVKTVEGPDIDDDGEPNQVADTLTINCQVPPTATPTTPPTATPSPTPCPTEGCPTPTAMPTEAPAPATSTPGITPPDTGAFGDSDGGLSVGLVALVSALLAAAVAGATTFAWRYRRAR